MNSISSDIVESKDEFDGSILFPDGEFESVTGRDNYLREVANPKHIKFFYDALHNELQGCCARYRHCPICNGAQSVMVFKKGGFHHVRCVKCSFLYVNPILNEQAMCRHYQEENDWTQVMLNDTDREMNRKMYRYTLAWINRHVPMMQSVIDIGAGTGLFVETAEQSGLSAQGTELNALMLSRAQSQGINVRCESLDHLRKKGGQFDLATLWFVLEHVPAPGPFLSEVAELLTDCGVVLVAIPNIDSLATRLWGETSGTFVGYSHINFFNLESLTRLASSHGLECLHAESYISGLSAIRRYMNLFGLSPTSGLHGFLRMFPPSVIHANYLGNWLCCLFQKKSMP